MISALGFGLTCLGIGALLVLVALVLGGQHEYACDMVCSYGNSVTKGIFWVSLLAWMGGLVGGIVDTYANRRTQGIVAMVLWVLALPVAGMVLFVTL